MKFEGLEEIKSFSEAARKYLGVNYYNASVKNKLLKFFSENGIDLVKVIEDNNIVKTVTCLYCGKEFTPKYEGNKFCSSSCAASYNNIRRKPVTDETKKRISESLLRLHYGENWEKETHKTKYMRSMKTHICKVCGKEFLSKKKDARYCSKECLCNDSEYKEKLRQKQVEKVKNGTHKGWQSRNIESYPEKFWKGVLDNNSIKYLREDFSTNKYFLDFLIVKNGIKIDLEIDGKQHKIRKEHDKERDRFLRENGFVVYRIEWNSINNDKGKKMMKEKIDAFISFYNSL